MVRKWIPQHLVYLWYFLFFAVLGVTLIFAGISYWGIWRNFKKRVAALSFGFSIIAAISFFITAAVTLIESIVFYNTNYFSYYNQYTYLFSSSCFCISELATMVIFGVMQILWGTLFIKARKYFGNSGLSIATGIMFIVSGTLTAMFIFSGVGLIVYFVSTFTATVGFFFTKMPAASSQTTLPHLTHE